MPVRQAAHDMKALPNCVYVISPPSDLTVQGGALKLQPRTEMHGQHLPIDIFLRSLAEDQGSRSVGIVLSGSGSDGALGLAEISNKGGVTFVQDPRTAHFDGMPRSAIQTGLANFILPPEGIAKELVRIARSPYLTRVLASLEEAEAHLFDEGGDLKGILAALRQKLGVDFTDYKRGTLSRRVLRRMVLNKIQKLSEYGAYLKENPGEVEELYNDILINVTRFFRDREAFKILNKIFPEIIVRKSPDVPIQIWVPGCSTGEEAYSLAISLWESLGENVNRSPIQIFGTDISERALAKARAGFYLENIAISP